jgi:molybdate/tungstate transport system substrate-binding protein
MISTLNSILLDYGVVSVAFWHLLWWYWLRPCERDQYRKIPAVIQTSRKDKGIKKGNLMRKTLFRVITVLSIILSLITLSACTGSSPSPAPASITPSPTPKPSPSASPVVSPSPSSSLATTAKLPIFNAGSLTVPWGKINDEFKKQNPGVEITSEAAGSAVTIRKVTEQKKDCGVLGSADYKLIPTLMFPGYADWYVIFGADQIVVCYTDKSKSASEITADNWYQVLQKDGVKFGRSDPDQDPAGYRTLMVWQLAEKFYNATGLYQKLTVSPGNVMKPKPTDLVAMLNTGELDYAFEYSAVAAQNNLKYVTLPDNINLSNKQYEDYYAQAKVNIKGTNPGETLNMTGEPILYAVTVPKSFANQELAVKWVDFMLSEKGTALIQATGRKIIKPRLTNDATKLPVSLQQYVK